MSNGIRNPNAQAAAFDFTGFAGVAQKAKDDWASELNYKLAMPGGGLAGMIIPAGEVFNPAGIKVINEFGDVKSSPATRKDGSTYERRSFVLRVRRDRDTGRWAFHRNLPDESGARTGIIAFVPEEDSKSSDVIGTYNPKAETLCLQVTAVKWDPDTGFPRFITAQFVKMPSERVEAYYQYVSPAIAAWRKKK